MISEGASCPLGYPTKGKDPSSGDLIHNVPGGAYYDATTPEECFAIGADAEAGDYRASKV